MGRKIFSVRHAMPLLLQAARAETDDRSRGSHKGPFDACFARWKQYDRQHRPRMLGLQSSQRRHDRRGIPQNVFQSIRVFKGCPFPRKWFCFGSSKRTRLVEKSDFGTRRNCVVGMETSGMIGTRRRHSRLHDAPCALDETHKVQAVEVPRGPKRALLPKICAHGSRALGYAGSRRNQSSRKPGINFHSGAQVDAPTKERCSTR